MRERNRRLAVLAAATVALMLSGQLGAVARLPDEVVMNPGAVARIPASAAVSACSGDSAVAEVEGGGAGDARLTAGSSGEAEVTFSLLGILPLRRMKVSVQPEKRLVPGGQSVGVAMNTRGVMVVGSSDLGTTPSPARLAGIKSGDVIERVDGVAVTGASMLSEALASGESACLTVVRRGERIECEITPALDARDGRYRLGAWVRDSTAGVGTLTWYDPDTGRFGALGHAITDVDTGASLPVGEGAVYANRVISVTPSRQGVPGELTGDFFLEQRDLGTVTLNSDYGIFGEFDAPPESAFYPEGLPVAAREQLHTGRATLLATVEGMGVGEYECEITKVSDRGGGGARSMVVKITDPALLERTGGIVQGMSGSPLIQDGRLIGALTHVMVDDPTMGYGLCIQTMLEAASQEDQLAA